MTDTRVWRTTAQRSSFEMEFMGTDYVVEYTWTPADGFEEITRITYGDEQSADEHLSTFPLLMSTAEAKAIRECSERASESRINYGNY